MKSNVERLNPVQYRVSIEITPDEVNVAFEGAYRNLQKKARIQGFRPGKAPLGVIRKLYGGTVAGEVHEKLVNQHLFSALNAETIRPIASPVVDTDKVPTENQPFAFSAVVDVMPTLEIDNYKGVAVSTDAYTVKDETLDRELHMICRRQARTRPTEPGEPAANGMLAAVNHSATQDGATLDNMTVEGMTVALGENEIFPGLEEHLIGMKVGDTKTAPVKLPDTYGDAALAGKELVFTLTITDLKHLDVPKFDDELAKDLNFESADKLKEEVKTHLDSKAKELARQKLETAVLDKILEANAFEVPPAMVDQVIDSMVHEMRHENEQQRNVAMRDTALRQSMLATAKRRTQNTLLLWHVTQKEKLQVEDLEVRQRVEETLASSGVADAKQLARLRKQLEPRVRENMIFEKAMNFIIDNAVVTEVPASL